MRALQLHEPLQPVAKAEKRYPGMDVSTFITAERLDGSGIGGAWCLEDSKEAVWQRLCAIAPNATVRASYVVKLRFAGMIVQVAGEPDVLWEVVRAKAEQMLDEVIAIHNRLHRRTEYQIAATHAEYEAGMVGGYTCNW